MKTTFSDINNADHREYEYTILSRGMGRVKASLICPFCLESTVAFIWSLRGSGKRCDNEKCGAMFSTGLTCFKKVSDD